MALRVEGSVSDVVNVASYGAVASSEVISKVEGVDGRVRGLVSQVGLAGINAHSRGRLRCASVWGRLWPLTWLSCGARK